MISEMTLNARKPQETEAGNQMLERMNTRHNEMALWALGHLDLSLAQDILDIGCGGGMNIKNMLAMSGAQLTGYDYSSASLKKSAATNAEALAAGRVRLIEGKVEELPFAPKSFDCITAFETIYYWGNIVDCFRRIRTCLRAGGVFMIFNEDYHPENCVEVMQALQATMHRPEELQELLEQAGFGKVNMILHENQKWLCAIAS